jgi:hypothetical protein
MKNGITTWDYAITDVYFHDNLGKKYWSKHFKLQEVNNKIQDKLLQAGL